MDAQTFVDQIRARLKTHEGCYASLARQSEGLSYSWLTKFAQGQAANPTVANLQQLIETLDAFEATQPPSPMLHPVTEVQQ